VDVVQLNAEIVRTDIETIRGLADRLARSPTQDQRLTIARELIHLVKGEFLAELRYDDWAVRSQVAIHSEIRQIILPLVEDGQDLGHDLGVRLSSVLLSLDPFDESAVAARAIHLAQSGRRAAARDTLTTFARQVREEFDEPPSEKVAGLLSELSQ
jgi:DNA-binding SARP family transcriptional activator